MNDDTTLFVSLGPPFVGPMSDKNSVFRVIMINETPSRGAIILWTTVVNWMDVKAPVTGYRH